MSKKKPSSYELQTIKYLDKKWINYRWRETPIKWRRLEADFTLRSYGRDIVIEVDWQYHDSLKAKRHDLKKDFIFYFNWLLVYRVTRKKDIHTQLDRIFKIERRRVIIKIIWTTTLVILLRPQIVTVITDLLTVIERLQRYLTVNF